MTTADSNNPTAAAGAAAERAAEQWLRARGLSSVARNFRCKPGEIDLVMRDGAQLVFIEVRLRNRDDYGGAAASVTRAKQQRLIRAAQQFLRANPQWRDAPCRFDVIAARGAITDGELSWQWLRDAFYADA
jgi:putative endonuclease